MTQYGDFAKTYAEGDYTNHSGKMAEILPGLLSEYDIDAEKILDLACGEGTFARKTTGNGYEVKGIDLSEELIQIAREKRDGESPEFKVGDMREFSESGFDIVTCWYDSLNYMKSISDLKSVFRNVRSALEGEGYFIFDINTYYCLSEEWPSTSCYVAQEGEDVFEVHRPNFDERDKIFTLKITCFQENGGEWIKFEEEHEEKAYRISEVEEALRDTGFTVIDVLGSLESRESLSDEESRAWFVAKAE